MIMEVFGLFTVLAIVLIGVGLFQKEAAFSIIGFSFLFVLSIILMGGVGAFLDNLKVESGQNITSVGGVYVVTYSYTDLTDSTTQWIGRFLAVASTLGVVAVLFELPKLNKSPKDSTYER